MCPQNSQKTLRIIFCSGSGTSELLVKAIYRGAESQREQHQVLCSHASETTVKNLAEADGIIFCFPENFGKVAGEMKNLLDRTYYPLEETSLNIPYALVISAGNDGSGAALQIERILKGYPMKPTMDAVLIKGVPTEKDESNCFSLGEAFMAGLSLGVF